MELEKPRHPTAAEREVLNFLLAPEFLGVEVFRVQAETAKVQTNCTCGCGSFSIVLDSRAPTAPEWASPTPTATDHDRVIDMFLLVQEGRLSSAEITHYVGDSDGVPSTTGFGWN